MLITSIIYEISSHQVLISEACDLLLHAELHQSIRRKGGEVVQHFLFLLQTVLQQLDLRVESL